MEHKIGTQAGEVFRYLESNGNCTMTKMKKALNLSSEDTSLALGWLARESKISLDKKKNSMSIALR